MNQFNQRRFVVLFVAGLLCLLQGIELPAAADPATYADGFVIATGLIHVTGIGIGLTIGKLFDGLLARGIGA